VAIGSWCRSLGSLDRCSCVLCLALTVQRAVRWAELGLSLADHDLWCCRRSWRLGAHHGGGRCLLLCTGYLLCTRCTLQQYTLRQSPLVETRLSWCMRRCGRFIRATYPPAHPPTEALLSPKTRPFPGHVTVAMCLWHREGPWAAEVARPGGGAVRHLHQPPRTPTQDSFFFLQGVSFNKPITQFSKVRGPPGPAHADLSGQPCAQAWTWR
jgi:hypothetical protein